MNIFIGIALFAIGIIVICAPASIACGEIHTNRFSNHDPFGVMERIFSIGTFIGLAILVLTAGATLIIGGINLIFVH